METAIKKTKRSSISGGYAAITLMIITLAVSAVLLSGLTYFSFQEVSISRSFTKSVEAKYVSESGVEDAVYRLVTGRQLTSGEQLVVGTKGTTTISIIDDEEKKYIRSEGSGQSLQQNLETRVDVKVTKIKFNYGSVVGAGGMEMDNNSRIEGSIYSNGDVDGASGATITGNAYVAGTSGDLSDVAVNGNAKAQTISGVTVGGNVDAYTFSNGTVGGSINANSISQCTIGGNAYYNTKSSCTIGGSQVTPNTPPVALATTTMPISDEAISDWKEDALLGGTCVQPQCDSSGNFKLTSGAQATLGPKKITGNLELDNGSTLTLTGILWVAGEIKLSNNCNVNLYSSYGGLSGLIITDSKVTISNNCAFQGSGVPGSYIMLLNDKNAPAEEVMVVDNNSTGVIYYANKGFIKFSNNATAREAAGYGLRLDNNAIITYEDGLANVNFSSGRFDIKHWKEVE